MPARTKAIPAASDAQGADFVTRHFGQRLKQLRHERGWSLEALAGSSGVSRSIYR